MCKARVCVGKLFPLCNWLIIWFWEEKKRDRRGQGFRGGKKEKKIGDARERE